jgi:hypothetical protein
LAGFWGQLGRLTKSGASDEPEAWYVWMREGARHAMHRSRHIGAEAAADAQQLV